MGAKLMLFSDISKKIWKCIDDIHEGIGGRERHSVRYSISSAHRLPDFKKEGKDFQGGVILPLSGKNTAFMV